VALGAALALLCGFTAPGWAAFTCNVNDGTTCTVNAIQSVPGEVVVVGHEEGDPPVLKIGSEGEPLDLLEERRAGETEVRLEQVMKTDFVTGVTLAGIPVVGNSGIPRMSVAGVVGSARSILKIFLNGALVPALPSRSTTRNW
jgi:hypothetical protein